VSFGYYPATIARHHLDTSFATALERQRREARDDVLLARRHPELGLQLPLAAYRRGRPQIDVARLGRGVARTARLERQGRRAAWRRDTARLLGDAYVSGLRDEVPSEEEFQALLGTVFAQAPATVEVRLDGGDPTPPVPVFGQVELAVHVGDNVVARVPAFDPGVPLDWASASDRVMREGSAAIRAAILSERLGRPGATAPRALELVDAR
jgi:hypothetical protein